MHVKFNVIDGQDMATFSVSADSIVIRPISEDDKLSHAVAYEAFLKSKGSKAVEDFKEIAKELPPPSTEKGHSITGPLEVLGKLTKKHKK